MTSVSGPKVRLVKCPKCLKVLPEVEDVPVYQCGGCFTILQAKKRSIDANGTWSAKVVETVQNSESQTVSEYKGSSCSSSRDNVLPSSGEFSPEQEYEEDQNRNGYVDSVKEQLVGVKLSDGDQTDEIQRSEISDGDSEKNEGENSRCEVNDDTLAVAAETSSDLRSLAGQEPTVAAREGTLLVGARGQEGDDQTCSDIVVCPDEEEQNQSNHYGGHPRVESTDDLANKNSSAYDGSVSSSSDGREDQIPDGQMGVSPSNDENERSVASEERLRKGKLLMQDYSGYKEQQTSASSVLSEEKQNKWNWNRSEELEGHPLNRNWRSSVKDEFSAHLPLYHRGTSFSGAYERGSPSYASLNELHSHPRAQYSLQMPQYGGGLRSGLVHIPAYNEHEALPRMYRDVSYVRHTRGRSGAHASMFSGIPFSGESVMTRRHHGGHSILYSGQFNSLYSSYPGSPQRHIEPTGYYPGWSHEIVSDVEDHHRRDSRELHTYIRERQPPVAKRQIRPVAGGAPFVTCYHCSKTLHLPVDFLIFKRKTHFLRCSNCNNVLRFSLQDTTHLVPASVTETQTKPSRKIDANKNENSASGPCRDEVSSKPEKLLSSSSKSEKLTVAKGSPLHRLMGYSSVSQVFKVSQRPPS